MKPEPIKLICGSGNVYRDFGYPDADARQLKAWLSQRRRTPSATAHQPWTRHPQRGTTAAQGQVYSFVSTGDRRCRAIQLCR